MQKVKITQIRSSVKAQEFQQETLKALGLRGIRKSKVHTMNPAIKGMITRVAHLVKVEEAQ